MNQPPNDGNLPSSDEFASSEPQEMQQVHVVPSPVVRPQVTATDAPTTIPTAQPVETQIEVNGEAVPAGEPVVLSAGDTLSIKQPVETNPLPEVEIAISEPQAAADVPVDTPAADDSGAGPEPKVADGVAEEETEEAFNFPPHDQLNNAEQEFEIYVPIDSADWDPEAVTLPLPPDTSRRTGSYINHLPNIDVTATEDGAEWAETARNGMKSGVFNDFGAGAGQRKDAEWRQKVMAGSKTLMAMRPKFQDQGPKLTGQRAVLQVQAMLSMGGLVSIPLWHSGFWITLKTPDEGRLLELHQRMAEDKILFGRVTHGLAFANHSVYTNGALIDLAMEHLYEHTVQDVTDTAMLRSMISQLDINMIAWGLACAIWPRGFQYSRSILDKAGKELRVVKEKLNVGYLQWVDLKSLDDYQRNHMALRTAGSMSLIAINTYRERAVRGKTKTFALSDAVHVELSVPSINQHLEAGQAWVNEVVAAVNGVFTEEQDLNQRNRYILARARATTMRQYRHWVSAFEFPLMGENGKRMDDPETVTMQLDALSANTELRNAFFDKVREFIEDSTVSIIATPLVDDVEKERTKPRFPWLLQMDPVSTFFILLAQKVQQIQARP